MRAARRKGKKNGMFVGRRLPTWPEPPFWSLYGVLSFVIADVVGPAELLQGLGTQAQGHPGAGRRGRRQPPGCQGVAPFQMGRGPHTVGGVKKRGNSSWMSCLKPSLSCGKLRVS